MTNIDFPTPSFPKKDDVGMKVEAEQSGHASRGNKDFASNVSFGLRVAALKYFTRF